MPLDTQTLCGYRMERAEESLHILTSILFIQGNLIRKFIS